MRLRLFTRVDIRKATDRTDKIPYKTFAYDDLKVVLCTVTTDLTLTATHALNLSIKQHNKLLL